MPTRFNRTDFFGPIGTNYHKFSTNNRPTEQEFKKLFDSIAFISETDDTASTTEQGLGKIAEDAYANQRYDNDGDGYTRFIVPHQLPTLEAGDGSIPDFLGTSVTYRGMKLTHHTYTDGSGDQRLNFKVENVLTVTRAASSSTAITITQANPGDDVEIDLDLSDYALISDMPTYIAANESGKVKYDSGDTIDYLGTKFSTTYFYWNSTSGEYEIADDSIDENKIVSTALGDGLTGGSGTKPTVDVDNSTIELDGTTGKVQVKDLGITKGKINSDVAGDGINKAATGELEVDVQNSIEISGGKVQLVNDSGTVGANRYYGTDEGGSMGWHELSGLKKATVVISNSDVLNLHTSDKQVMAGLGADKGINVVEIVTMIPYNGTAYATTGNIEYHFNSSATGNKIGDVAASKITTSADMMTKLDNKTVALDINQKIVISATAAITGAGGDIQVVVYYTEEGWVA